MSTRRERSASEPSLLCSNYVRDRVRKTDLDYERGKDKLAFWIGSWGYEELCAVLECLVTRCPLNQMEYLWTATESVPHRDFLYTATLDSSPATSRKIPTSVSLERRYYFRPLSTPISRQITSQLKKSRSIENKRLHRLSSVSAHTGMQATLPSNQKTVFNDIHLFESPVAQSESQILLLRSIPEGTASSKLPGLDTTSSLKGRTTSSTFHCSSTQPPTSESRRMASSRTPTRLGMSSPIPSRILTPMRRHMTSLRKPVPASRSLGYLESCRPMMAGGVDGRPMTPGNESQSTAIKFGARSMTPTSGNGSRTTTKFGTRPTTRLDTRPTTGQTFLSEINQVFFLPPEGPELLTWFSELREDWQQQETLQLIVCNLDKKELYFLSALLMDRQYHDFVTKLPEDLAIKLLSYIPARQILSNCCRVSCGWNTRCSNEKLWEIKAHQFKLGLPMKNIVSWKNLYLDDLRLKRCWMKAMYTTKELDGHTRKVLSVALKGNLVVSGSSDHTVRVWNLTTSECMCILQGHLKAVWCVCFYGKNFVISGSGDGIIKIWNYRTEVCERTLEFHQGPVWSIQQKKELLVSGGNNKMVCVWDVRKCRLMKTLVGHRGVVFAVSMDNAAERVYSGDKDGVIRQWDIASGICLKVVKISQYYPIMALDWSKGFLGCSCGRQISLWATGNWEEVATFNGHIGRIDSIQLRINNPSNVSGILLSASRDKTIKYWDIKSGMSRTLEVEASLNCAQFNDTYIVSGANQTTIKVWDFHPHNKNNQNNEQTMTNYRLVV